MADDGDSSSDSNESSDGESSDGENVDVPALIRHKLDVPGRPLQKLGIGRIVSSFLILKSRGRQAP